MSASVNLGKSASTIFASGATPSDFRAAISSTRNYAGSIVASNGITTSATESGLFYSMALPSVQTINLPSTAGLSDGFSVIIRATGLPSGYQTAWVAAAVGNVIAYRTVEDNKFYLIGNDEVFRFTWMSGMDKWVAECLVDPRPVNVNATYNANSYGGGLTSWTRIPLNLMGGDTAPFQLSSSAINVPITGIWAETARVYFYSANAANNYGYLLLGDPFGASYNTIYGYDQKIVIAGTVQYGKLSYTFAVPAGSGMSAFMLMGSTGLYYYYSLSYVNLTLISR